MSDEREYFTLVFKGNLANFKGNPLKTDTPFGVPFVCGYGDAFEKADALEIELEDLKERFGITEVVPDTQKTL